MSGAWKQENGFYSRLARRLGRMSNTKKNIIFHVDVNSAFLSWESLSQIQQGKPDLREIPAIIGRSYGNKGIVLAKSIPAKRYGIETAEPIFSALRKCPSLVVVPPSFHVYEYNSKQLVKLLRDTFPVVEQYSIDECFIDYKGMENIYGDALQTAYRLKSKIKEELGFTVNVGVSSNKVLAKMASDLEKPNKLHTMFPWEIEKKLWPQPVGNLFMVGKASTKKLQAFGINTIEDLARSNKEVIERMLKKQGLLIWNYANGIDGSPVKPENHTTMDSISNETTLYTNITDKETAYNVILALAEKVAARLRKANRYCQVISITIKNSEFNSYFKQRKLQVATNSTERIIEVARELLNEVWRADPVRLLGVGVSSLTEEPLEQLELFDPIDNQKQTALDRAVDKIRGKFGYNSIIRSSLIKHTDI